MISDPWNNAYWTCFFNAGIDLEMYHVTHKYFGPLPKEEVDDVIYIIDSHFEVKPPRAIEVEFNIPMFFDQVPGSGDGLVKVYCTDDERIESGFSDLREAFWPYAKDTYPTYTPHLTNGFPRSINLNRYALLLDNEVVRVWDFASK